MRSSSIILAVLLTACGYGGNKTDPSSGDWDGDGYSGEQGDCANENADYHPGADDAVGDGIDQNCDHADGVDADGDGNASTASGGDDCDDTSRDIQPGAFDAWYDGVDSDCMGDDDFDQDLDGVDSDEYGGEDCADTNPDIPTRETWNGIDDDCNGCIDEIGAEFAYMDDTDGNPVMVVTLQNADPHQMWMGLAETSQGGAGWYGEDCKEGTSDLCHPLDSAGGTFSVVQDTTDVNMALQTYFDQGRLPGSAAIFWDTRGRCTVMGEGTEYYAIDGCCMQEGW